MEAPVEVVFTIGYFLIALCLAAPPTEFVSVGLTVQNLFSSFLGSEDLSFVQYHVKRTSVTLVFHSLFPLGYYLGLGFCKPELLLFYPWLIPLTWRLFLTVSVILPLSAGILVAFWHQNGWTNHPIAKTLQGHAPRGNTWRSVASVINVEFRRIDKFTTGIIGRRVIVTDSWIMLTSTYYVHIAHQPDVHLTLENTEEHELSHESETGVQFLNITVNSINEHVKNFKIRLNAMEYSDLRDKLQQPVRNVRNVMIQQSLSDRFIAEFRKQVEQNHPYRKPSGVELEACIGCMQKQADVKLQKLCDEPQEGACSQCFCRPMWCQDCMGKWFASRQDQADPGGWMSSKSPCPTCRAPFCMLDVCKVL